jgi:hypothetical protein
MKSFKYGALALLCMIGISSAAQAHGYHGGGWGRGFGGGYYGGYHHHHRGWW